MEARGISRGLGVVILGGALLTTAGPARGATIEVETTNQDIAADGVCSLPEAVGAARNNLKLFECRKGQASETDVILLEGEAYPLVNEMTLGGGPVELRGKGDDTELQAGDGVRPFTVESGPVRIEKLEIENGDAGSTGDGGNIHVEQGRLTLSRATLDDGDADDGGNIFMAEGTRLHVSRSEIVSGDAHGEPAGTAVGGGIFLEDEARAKITRSLIAANQVEHDSVAAGGGIYASGGKLTLVDTMVIGNEAHSSNATSGGAVFSDGSLTIRRSTLGGNDAGTEASTSIGGALSLGGDGAATIVNSTFSSNEADEGGAIRANSPAFLAHVSFRGNDSTDGDHLFAAADGDVTLRNSILPSPLSGDSCETEGGGGITSLGFSVFELQDVDCPLSDTDEVVSDVGYDPDGLQENGGPTTTIALLPESEAVNLVPTGKCKPAKGEDQRGFGRPKRKRCDSGAFELGAKRRGRPGRGATRPRSAAACARSARRGASPW